LIYAGVIGAEDEADPTQLDKAEEIILSYLGQGEEVRATVIYGRGEAEGISDKTMKAAKKALGVESFQRRKAWYWRIPNQALKVQQVAPCPPRQSSLNLQGNVFPPSKMATSTGSATQ
jgi:TnpA family transposase